MNTISTKLFLEQVRAGAELHPQTASWAVVQVGRFQYECDLRNMTQSEAAEFEGLYRSARLRFAHPGDFTVAPCCFRRKELRTRIVDAARLTSIGRNTKR